MAPVSRAQRLGRYVLYEAIASGGMASIHFGRMLGAHGFARSVAIKRLHPHLALDPEFVAMFLDEARLAARIHHPNVVQTLDVVSHDGELFLVMEYVVGDALSRLARAAQRAGELVPLAVVSAIGCGALHGLHAAHEARDESGAPLAIVHRDVSPQNVLVGVDGVARVLDFGVAKAAARLHTTQDGTVKGKLAYMAPEQLHRRAVDRRADIYALAVVLWELVAGRRLFVAEDAGALIAAVLMGSIPPLASLRPEAGEFAEVITRALDPDPAVRPATAMDFARELQAAVTSAPQDEVADWVRRFVGAEAEARRARLAEIESDSASDAPLAGAAPRDLADAETSATPVFTAVEPPQRRASANRRLAIGAMVAVGVGAAAFVAHLAAPAVSDGASPAASASPGPSASFSVTPSAEVAAVSASVSAPPPPPPPRVVPAASVVPRVSKVSPAATPSASAGPPPRPAQDPCDPPTYLDAQGIKRVKPGC